MTSPGLTQEYPSLDPVDQGMLLLETAGAREDPWESSQALCRQEREEQRRREKEAKQLEKDRSKAEKEAQRSFQKKVAEVNRNDAVREIEVHFSADLETPSSLIAGALPEIKTRLDDNLCKWFFDSREDSPHPGLIRFRRHVRARWDNTTKRFYPLDQPRWEWDKSVLVLSSADDLVDMISQGGDYLNTWMADLRMIAGLSADTQIILIIKGLEKYYSKTKTLANREYTAAARAGLQPGSISTQNATITRIERDAVVAALLELQFAEKAYIVKVEKTEDIEDWIWNLAADIAVRPYKLLSKSHLSFAPPEHLRKATNSTDALELMLQEVLGITPSAASGIAAKYPTFAELMTAFERAEARGGLAKAEALLADCEIKNLRNGTASGRKLNKALAKKVYQAFRGEDSLALA
ncbi:hypothetical protein BD324DRAFT_643279 [Kockovaella imperatae]|uniref:ERCC4 domain-containing protein n=1 Tax=Kockovaella imperatae TaxID=4999 RepID=A0A1Y1U9Q1_9TREE|nr:hypothetical protein BD324DRAFT_643279 [Kockovaella imperatae]ORX34758.1 hypothetical protein BD324DRAFT_643279 [Kockovaella imperatae]